MDGAQLEDYRTLCNFLTAAGLAEESVGGKGGGKGSRGGFDESSFFTGAHREYGDTMVAPDLLEYVSKEVEREASVMKQARKAREEHAMAKKKKGYEEEKP